MCLSMEISGLCIRSRRVATSCWEPRRVRVGCVLKHTHFKREQVILLPKCLVTGGCHGWGLDTRVAPFGWKDVDVQLPFLADFYPLFFKVTPLCSGIQELGSASKPKSKRPNTQLEWQLPAEVSGNGLSSISCVGCRDLGELAPVFSRLEQANKWPLGHTAESTFHLDVSFSIDPSLGFAGLHTEGDLKESSLIVRLIPLLKQLQWFLTITVPNLPSEHKWN